MIAEIRSLSRRKARREQGAFLVEGVRLVRDALDVDADIHTVIVCQEMLGAASEDISQEIRDYTSTPRILDVAPAVMRSLTDTETPQGIVAVVGMPQHNLPDLDPRSALVLVLDEVHDPGNVGTLLRAGAAAGCTAVVCITGGADPFAPKVVRAAAGAHFRVPVIAYVTWDGLGPSLAALPVVYGADGASALPYDTVDWKTGAAIVVGNEDHGLSADARTWCRNTVAIPMARGVESLNAAVSGAIILFEAVRQRRHAATT